MESFIPSNILVLLSVSLIVSSLVMIVIQKLKQFTFINKDYQIGIINFFISFSIGIPFSIYFYQFNIFDACWVSIFSFVGAPSIYDILKNQTIINYTPATLKDPIEEIKRDDL
ncbi:MAG: hypothetical protein RR404_00280 [Bacilli bacterium]